MEMWLNNQTEQDQKNYKYRAIFTIGVFGNSYSEYKEKMFCDEKFDVDKTMRNNC